MTKFLKSIAASVLTMAAFSSAALATTSSSISGFHPYFCDADGNNPMTVRFLNDPHHRLYLNVTVPQENINFNCENAGGLVRFSSPVSFQSISVWVKTSGDINLCNDIDFAWIVCGQPHFACLTEAQRGITTHDGWTFYKLSASSVGCQNAPITAAGMEVARDPSRSNNGRRPGQVGFIQFKVNDALQTPVTQVEDCCPFSNCY